MATPLTATQLLAALKAEGVNYVELPGWKTHRRSGAFSPEVFMLHYTAGDYGANAGDRNHDTRARGYAGKGGILWDGRAGVPGPLCHFGIDKAGTVWLTGWGRANHAGRVDATAITLARNGKLPTSGTHRPGADDSDGNAVSYGIEMMTASAPTAAQLEAAEKVMAAVLRAHGWPGTRVIGHGEASRRKTGDPRGVDMGAVRRRVTARLNKPSGSGGFKPVTPKPTQPQQEEDDMPSRLIEKTFEFQHGGADYQVELAHAYFKATKPIKRFSAHAVVHGPDGHAFKTRWVAWVHDTAKREGFWDRRAETVHTASRSETSHQGFTVDDKVDLFLDVSASKPGKYWVSISALIWE